MIWLALAAQLSAPVPTNMHNWFEVSDMPQSVMAAGNGIWLAGIRVEVAPDGKIHRCSIEVTSKIRDLDELTCKLVRQRAKFSPARWTDGSPAYGAYRTAIDWVLSDHEFDVPGLGYPDLEVFVQALPAGVHGPSFVRVMFAVDPSGKTSACRPEAPGFEKAENIPALIPVACEQLLSSYRAIPPTDALGRPVTSVQDALVKFSVQKN